MTAASRARDLVDKLDRLAKRREEDARAYEASASANDVTAHLNAARLWESATNYAHAAELARNVLKVKEKTP